MPPQLLGIYTINTTTELIFVQNNSGVFGSLIQSVAYPIRGNIHTAEETRAFQPTFLPLTYPVCETFLSLMPEGCMHCAVCHHFTLMYFIVCIDIYSLGLNGQKLHFPVSYGPQSVLTCGYGLIAVELGRIQAAAEFALMS